MTHNTVEARIPLASGKRSEATRARRSGRAASAAWKHAFLLVFSAFAILPGIFSVLASFKNLYDFYNDPLGLPTVWHWENYVQVWTEARIPQAALNTFTVVVLSVPLVLACACCTAYGISRFTFRGNNVLYYLFLLGMIIPAQLTILPQVLLEKNLGLINTYAGLILPYVGIHMPFATFVLASFARTLPGELHDAALIDGANEWQAFARIMLPLLRPAVATVAILNSVSIWNDFFFPLIVSPKLPMLQVAVYGLVGQYSTNWGQIFAGVVLSALPLVIAYLMLTRQFIAGLSAGAIKG
jgi:raffinose/stachyose/melibiose transport system permease protein